jgi:plastocyanin
MKKSVSFKGYKSLGLSLLFMVSLIFVSCKKSTDTNGTGSGPGTNEVWIQNMAFNPLSITVKAGTTITWTNKDAVSHTVTSNDSFFDSGAIPGNGTYTHQFTGTGTLPYHCTIHPAMSGTVVVD